jgi:hypothetical protein
LNRGGKQNAGKSKGHFHCRMILVLVKWEYGIVGGDIVWSSIKSQQHYYYL